MPKRDIKQWTVLALLFDKRENKWKVHDRRTVDSLSDRKSAERLLRRKYAHLRVFVTSAPGPDRDYPEFLQEMQ